MTSKLETNKTFVITKQIITKYKQNNQQNKHLVPSVRDDVDAISRREVRERLGDRPPRADLVGPDHVALDPRLDPRVDELRRVVR